MILTLPRIALFGLVLFLAYMNIATARAYVIEVYGTESNDRKDVVYRLDSSKIYGGSTVFVCHLNTLYYYSDWNASSQLFPFYDYRKNTRYCVIRRDLILTK